MKLPDPATSSNFNAMPDAQTVAGSTLENLKASVQGETGASAKYAAFAEAADAAGFPQPARLFRAASAAEKIHISLESKLILDEEPDYALPTAGPCEPGPVDTNLIAAASGEIFETSDMYPVFIKKAQEEGKSAAVTVFTRAKAAEAYHAQLYLDAYNTLDNPTDDNYYLCPGCGYIQKGDEDKPCPVCGASFSIFKEFK